MLNHMVIFVEREKKVYTILSDQIFSLVNFTFIRVFWISSDTEGFSSIGAI